MMYGTLKVQSFSPRLSAPISNVKVTVTRGEPVLCTESCCVRTDCVYVVYTDAEGNAPLISLPAPDKALSLDEQNNTRPYSVWNLKGEKEGYQSVEITGVQVFAQDTAMAMIEMIPAQRMGAPTPVPEDFTIPPHSLYQTEGTPSTAPIENCSSTFVLDAPIIPETVIVHLGKPTASARNVTVSFRQYIANVASSEVYPTWVEATKPTDITK